MQSPPDLHLLVDKYAAMLPDLKLDGDDQEEYSTMLLRLQNQVEGGTPNPSYVDQCLSWLERFTSRVSPAVQGNALPKPRAESCFQ